MWIARTVVATALAASASVGWGKAIDPQKQLEAATAEVTYMSFERALPMYEQVAKAVPEGSEQWQQAIFGEALCQQQVMPATAYTIGEAKRLFELLLSKCPNSTFVPRAMMNLGRIAELVDYKDDTSDREKAREWYTKAMNVAKGTPIEGEAVLRIAATYIQSYAKDQDLKGIGMLREYLQSHPGDPLASAMWQYMGETYFYPLQDYKSSLECYKKADALGLLEEGREGPVYWRMAIMADRYLNDRDTAIEYYKKIIVKTPTSGKAYEAQLALKKLGVEPPKIKLFDMMAGETSAMPATAPIAASQEAAK